MHHLLHNFSCSIEGNFGWCRYLLHSEGKWTDARVVSNINDNNVPDLKLDTLGQADDDFGSFFSAQTSAALAADKDKSGGGGGGGGGAVLPSQLFDLDQSLFSLQTPKQGMIQIQMYKINLIGNSVKTCSDLSKFD